MPTGSALAKGPIIFACSPRHGGTSDLIASLAAEGLAAAGASPSITTLRDFSILPCLGCHACAASPDHACVLAEDDDCEELFARILAAPLLILCSPIYFYHLPAGFKALIDRAQRFYEIATERERAGDPLILRPAHAVLLAGRPRGEKLFEGAVLTLRYFLRCFGLRLEQPLELRGLDGPEDVSGGAAKQIRDYAARSWERMAAGDNAPS